MLKEVLKKSLKKVDLLKKALKKWIYSKKDPDGPSNGPDSPPNDPDGGAGDRRLRPG